MVLQNLPRYHETLKESIAITSLSRNYFHQSGPVTIAAGAPALVLKYRTYNPDAEGFSLQRSKYNGEVYADAKQAIHILRIQAAELGIDPDKIGIAGYSAGGGLSLMAAPCWKKTQVLNCIFIQKEDTALTLGSGEALELQAGRTALYSG